MKKSLFIFAAAALALTACTSEDDVVQSATQQTPAKAVAFDVYLPHMSDVTRATAGRTGTMTTTTLQASEAKGGGFGVFGYYTDNADYSASATPNFMYNEKVLWNSTNLGWYYSPLKYWPNETNKDSQESPAYSEAESTPGSGVGTTTDKLTFFAYAPYVSAVDATGITSISGNTDTGDALIGYKADLLDPNENVDLLWGVAPAGGLNYTAVNKNQISIAEGKPLVDMVKPDVNTSMKFLFQHALARIGVKVIAAIDQVAPGGKLDPNTKITIESVKLKGYFGESATLNLNNTIANTAKWQGTFNGVALAAGTAANGLTQKTIEISGNKIAEHLRYKVSGGTYPTKKDEQDVVGVTTKKQDLIAPSTKYYSKLAGLPTYYSGKIYYSDDAGTEAHPTYTFDSKSIYYTYTSSVYSQKNTGSETAPDYPEVKTTTDFYTLTETGDYTADPSLPASTKYYTRTGDGSAATPYVYTNAASPTWDGSTHYYTVEGTKVLADDIPFTYSGDIYAAASNFFMVIPTNNIPNICTTNWVSDSKKKELRTVDVEIIYYITTEDAKLDGGRAQTRNKITKTVVFPSFDNGKSYNLNLILGLTSVKLEAEVDDWKIENVNADLPQNIGE